MTEVERKNKTFFGGSWHTYKLKDIVDPDKFSMERIKRSQNAFRDNYYATVELVFPSPIFLSWLLTLKQLPIKRRKSPRKSPRRVEEKVSEKASIFKLSLYTGAGKEGDETFLFCNRIIPNKIEKLIKDGLRCSDIEKFGLDGSSPPDLLKLHLDANRRSFKLKGLCLKPLTDFNNLGIDEESSNVVKKIGRIEDEHLPKIKRVDVVIKDAPLNYNHKSKIAKLDNWRFSSVEMEIKSTSIFHLYGDLSEYLYEKDVPNWLSDGIRKRGKTSCRVHYD